MRFNFREKTGNRTPRFVATVPMPTVVPAKTVEMKLRDGEPREAYTRDRKLWAEKLVVYIAGKITGDPGYREKFAAAEEKLLVYQDVVVLNPANTPLGLRPVDYMRIAFAQIEAADLVLFLTDWKESQGARLEMSYCSYVGKPVRELPKNMEGWRL